MRVRLRLCACVRACVHACVRASVCVYVLVESARDVAQRAGPFSFRSSTCLSNLLPAPLPPALANQPTLQSSAVCQLTPDPFRVVFSDVGGEAFDDLVANSGEVLDAVVDAANDCLVDEEGEGFSISDLSFDDLDWEVAEDGTISLVGDVWGSAGKNPAGVLE